MDTNDLIAMARAAYEEAVVPYSGYPVGAALEASDGTTFLGCNVEIANYSNSLHAEEVAVGQAIAAGHRTFRQLAVSSARQDGITPCGMCRQTLAEFCGNEFPIFCDEGTSASKYTLGQLLPNAMGPETLADD